MKAKRVYDELKDVSHLDFTEVACGAKTTVRTYVELVNDNRKSVMWLTLGQVDINYHNALSHWTFQGHASDEIRENGRDHDGVFLVRMNLVGVQFKGVYLGGTQLVGWIEATDFDDFRVPNSTNVLKKNAPYVPPSNPKLWKRLRGRKVEIGIHAVYAKDEEPK